MTLAQDVVSNYLSHSPEIMANFSKAKADYSEGNFYSAGQDTAAIVNLLVPFNSSLAYMIDIEDHSDYKNLASSDSIWAIYETFNTILGNGEHGGEACWKMAHGRGVGKPISACPEDKEKNGLLCYPYCREGYAGVGPVCW